MTAPAIARTSARCAAREGMAAALPVVASFVPFALVVGATLAASSVDPVAGWSTSWVIYGASAQLAVVGMLGDGAGIVTIVAIGLAINARLVAYAAALAPGWGETRPGWRAVAAYLLVDPTYALAAARAEAPATPTERRSYYLGVAITMWCTWVAVTGAGALLGDAIASRVDLTMAAPLAIIGLVVPMAATRSTRVAALLAAGIAVAAVALPYGLGAIAGAALAVSVAETARRWSR